MWDLADRELVDGDMLLSQRREDGIAKAAVRVVLLRCDHNLWRRRPCAHHS